MIFIDVCEYAYPSSNFFSDIAHKTAEMKYKKQPETIQQLEATEYNASKIEEKSISTESILTFQKNWQSTPDIIETYKNEWVLI